MTRKLLEAQNLDFLFVLTFMRNGSDKGEVRKGTGRVMRGRVREVKVIFTNILNITVDLLVSERHRIGPWSEHKTIRDS